MKRLIIASDYPLVRFALRLLFEEKEYKVIAEIDNNSELSLTLSQLQPDLLFIDILLFQQKDAMTVKEIMSLTPATRILIFADISQYQLASELMRDGACGFITKDAFPQEIISAVKNISLGYKFFPADIMNAAQRKILMQEKQTLEKLSPREYDIFKRLTQGYSNKEIADELYLSNKTVSTYKTRLMSKFSAKSLVDLVEIAQRNSLF